MDIGKNLLNAVAAIKSASSEIGDLFGEFENALAGQAAGNGARFRAAKQSADPDSFRTGWVQDGWLQIFLAYEGGKVRTSAKRGEVILAIDLGHPGWFAERVGKPYVLFFWAPADDTWTGYIDDPETFVITSGEYGMIGERIFVWLEEDEDHQSLQTAFKGDPLARAWFFAVPLMAIDSRKKVHDYLVQPIFDFLNTRTKDLPTDHPADRFSVDETGMRLVRASP